MATLLTLTAGTMLAIWLGKLIDEQGIGNGISLIIFGGIISGIPQRLAQMAVTSPWSHPGVSHHHGRHGGGHCAGA